jgi:hypothetical protein
MNRIVEYYSKKTTGTRAPDDANRSGIKNALGTKTLHVIDAKHLVIQERSVILKVALSLLNLAENLKTLKLEESFWIISN